MTLPPEQEALFRETLLVMEKARLPYTVAAGFALREHTAISRFTKDLDLFLSPSNASRALHTLSDSGFECEICDPVWLAKVRRDDYFVDLITGMSNGAITVDDSWIERSRPAVILGIPTKVLAPEELLVSKLFVTRRERFDGADITHIIYSLRGMLDWDRVLQLAGEHWELVFWNLVLFRYVYPAHSNYVPHSIWNELVSRFNDGIQPKPDSRFRGSLIDDKMFAIDVNEWGLDNLGQELREKRVKITASALNGI